MRGAIQSMMSSGCVPDWNVGGGLDVGMRRPSASAKGRSAQLRRSNHSFACCSPDYDFEELCWENGQLLVVMPGQNIKYQKQPGSVSLHQQIATDDERALVGEFATENAGTLEASVTNNDERAGVVPAGVISDEVMVAWLQYSLDEEAVMNYCPEPRVDISNSAIQSGKDCGGKDPSQEKLSPPAAAQNCLLEQAFCNSSSPHQPNPINRIPCDGNTADKGRTSGSTSITQSVGAAIVSSEILSSKMQPVAASSHCFQHLGLRTASMNFSHFSKPAVTMKANLQDIGRASGPLISERLKQFDRVVVEACMPIGSLIRSTDVERSLQGPKGQREIFLVGYSVPQCLTVPSILHPTENHSMNEGDAAVLADESASAKAVGTPHGCRSGLAGDAAIGNIERALDAPEPTIISSSGGSDNSAGKHDKFCYIGGKRKAAEVDDFEIQSEAQGDYFGDVKKPPMSLPSSTKRARAAEVHNQSERRRRDRINEKMKALQELIPNVNKTDKASLLEEAIKYLKSLQAQLQMMTYRSGMTMSPKWIPQWLPHLQMSQMASLPQAGMAMACGMGMGNGLVGMGTGPLVSLPTVTTSGTTAPQSNSLPGPFVPTTHFPPDPKAGLPSDSQAQLQNSSAMDYRTVALPYPVHLKSQPGRMNMYNPIMLQQHLCPKK